MEINVNEFINKILYDPVIGKIILAVLLSLLILAISKIIQKNIEKQKIDYLEH